MRMPQPGDRDASDLGRGADRAHGGVLQRGAWLPVGVVPAAARAVSRTYLNTVFAWTVCFSSAPSLRSSAGTCLRGAIASRMAPRPFPVPALSPTARIRVRSACQ
jgi:hypothetical protein